MIQKKLLMQIHPLFQTLAIGSISSLIAYFLFGVLNSTAAISNELVNTTISIGGAAAGFVIVYKLMDGTLKEQLKEYAKQSLIAGNTDIVLSSIDSKIEGISNNVGDISLNINTVVGSLSAIYRNGAKSSLKQVELMLANVLEQAEEPGDIDIYEINLDPNPPGKWEKGVKLQFLPGLDELLTRASEGKLIQWHMIVGHQGNIKKEWVDELKQSILGKYDGCYRIIEIENSTPSLNMLIIPAIDQVYIGMGEWLEKNVSGGIWIKNKQFASAMKVMFQGLESQSE
jgi:hypothetical protein